jgi:mono/diheme cytochrome c family protein
MRTCHKLAAATSFVTIILLTGTSSSFASPQTQRGKYLVTIAGCSDCHTPGSFLGKPDTSRYLGGSDVGFNLPGLGIFAGANITPDKETGIGKWSEDDIVTAITTGKRPDGRMLAPIMPYESLKVLNKSDAYAIAAYLKSIPAVKNAVAGPFGPNEKPSIFVFTVLPAPVFNGLPKPKQ